MPKLSAGIVLVRTNSEPARAGPHVDDLRVLLVHPGGPFWRNKDSGAWSIPKGEYEPDDDPRTAALREFGEELGVPCPSDELIALGSIRQKGGKVVTAWCAVGDIDVSAVRSNTFEMEWPPRSRVLQVFPEVDRAEFFSLSDARRRIVAGQSELIDRAVDALQRAGLV